MTKRTPARSVVATPADAPCLDVAVLFAPVEAAIAAMREGRIVVVVDDEDRENEGDFTSRPRRSRRRSINFMVTHGRGLVCLAMTPERLDALEIPLAVPVNSRCARRRCACPSTRAARRAPGSRPPIVRRPSSRPWRPGTRPQDLLRPGHIFAAACARRRRARPRGPYRSRRGSGAARRTHAGRRHLRNHDEERQHGAGARAVAVREAIRPAAHHDRRPDQVPDADRAAGASGSRRAKLPTEHGEFQRARLREPARSARRTSRWCAATSATAQTSWSACTRSASRATSSTPRGATAARSWRRRCSGSPPKAVACCCI